MSALATLRRWFDVLANPPQFATHAEAFAFLAADARREAGGCGCLAVSHALTMHERAVVTTHLSAARAAAEAGDLAAECQVDYLAQRLARCPSTDPTARQLADRAAEVLREARGVWVR